MGQKVILLNGGQEHGVEPFSNADAYLVRLLGAEPARRAVLYLRSMQDDRGRQRIAVFVGSQQVGYLPADVDGGLVTTVKACEMHGAVARARGTLTASWEQPGKVLVKVDLADAEHLLSNSAQPAVTGSTPSESPQVPDSPFLYAEPELASGSTEAEVVETLSSSLEDSEAPVLSAGWTEDYPDWPPAKPKPTPIDASVAESPAEKPPEDTPAESPPAAAPQPQVQRQSWLGGQQAPAVQQPPATGTGTQPATTPSPAIGTETTSPGGAGPLDNGRPWQDQTGRAGAGPLDIDGEIVAAWTSSTPSDPQPAVAVAPITGHRSARGLTTWLLASLAVLVVFASAFLVWKMTFAPKTHVSDAYGYSFAYPGRWETASEEELSDALAALSQLGTPLEMSAAGYGFNLTHPNDAAVVAVVLFDGGAFGDSYQLEANLRMSIDQLNQDPSVKLLAPVAATAVGSLQGYSTTIEVVSDQFDARATYCYLIDSDFAYMLMVMSTPWTWDDNQKTFERFFDSFEPATVRL